MRGIVISFVLSIQPCSSLKQDHATSAAATAATLAHEMGHNFGMYHDDDCKSANDIYREVYSSGCSRFNAFLNPNCRIIITLPNHNTLIIQMDQTLPFKLCSPVLISSQKASFTASSSEEERETPGNEAASSMLHFCFVLLCIWGQFPSTSTPGRLYLEGRFNGGFFALRVWGAYTWRGFRNFTVYWYKHCYCIFFQVALNLRSNTFFPLNVEYLPMV